MTGMTGMTSDFYPFEMDFIGRVATAGTTGVSDFPHKLIGVFRAVVLSVVRQRDR